MRIRNLTSLAAALAFLPFASGCPNEVDAPEQIGSVDQAIGAQAASLNPRRSLIETNVELLAPGSLGLVLHWVTANANLQPFPEFTHNLFFNLYNDAANDVFNIGKLPVPHRPCDDPHYQSILNNFPFACPRNEGSFATASLTEAPEMADWKVIAAVNRIDMAPEDGSHCGEQRMILAHEGGPGRDFIIFEAQIPNPSPDLGKCACAPIAQFWANLSSIDSVDERRIQLERAFLSGHGKLKAAGIGPFMAAGNFTIGTGQIRTNNFAQGPWSLREHKLIEWRDLIWPLPFPVTSNLHAPLLADNATDPRAAKCKDSFLQSFSSLLPDDPNLMALAVPDECYDAESPNNFNQGNYATQLNGNPVLQADVQARLDELGSRLSPSQIMNRATFSGSCIGCHQEGIGQELGFSDGTTGNPAPFSMGFVQVHENLTEDCGDGTTCFSISSALSGTFLPHRQTVMENLLAECSAPGISVVAVEPVQNPVFSAEGATLATGELDAETLKAEDTAAKSKANTIGGSPAGRAH